MGDDALAELEVLVGFDDDLAGEATRLGNRIRGLLTGIHPALERAIGPKISHPAVLEILSRCGGPTGIRKVGRRRLASIATKHAPRMSEKLVDAILTALDEQTVTVPGTTAADTVLPRLADNLKTVLQQRKQVAEQVEEILDAHPLAGVKGEHPARTGNRKLKRAFFLAAFAALICLAADTATSSTPCSATRPTTDTQHRNPCLQQLDIHQGPRRDQRLRARRC